ncbi:hypothetical protein AB0953_19850 [Streptomyces sp. NPDC046866]|uniref:hypothetical protein n=1 Tax=Streptomyces sp. NPDC046866 TaxID=3154921 RepID=UPI003452B539
MIATTFGLDGHVHAALQAEASAPALKDATPTPPVDRSRPPRKPEPRGGATADAAEAAAAAAGGEEDGARGAGGRTPRL